MKPVVTCVIPSWDDHRLMSRAIPSVLAQTYRPLRLWVISDGPDPALKDLIEAEFPEANYIWRQTHEPPSWSGNSPRRLAVESPGMDISPYVAFLDSDDSWEPQHVETVMEGLLEHPETGFGYGQALMHLPGGGTNVIGTVPPAYGGVTTSAIVARTDLCRRINWGPESAHGDWDLIEKWLADGQVGYMSDEVSVHLFPASLGVNT